jgi:hypothetical protein
MRSIEFTKSSILLEGGNIWKDALKTQRINKSDVVPTVKFLEKITNLPLVDNMLGTTGRKASSGDLDLAVDAKKYTKDELVSLFKNYADNNDKDALVKKSGVSVHFRTPINGDKSNGYVQTDFMFLDDVDFAKWSMTQMPSEYKGAAKHIILNSIAKSMGLKWSFLHGLSDRDSGDLLRGGKDPKYVAQTLFGKDVNKDTISTVENMLDALKNDPKRDEKLADAKETLAKDNIKI